MRKYSNEFVSDVCSEALSEIERISGSRYKRTGRREALIRPLIEAGWTSDHIIETLRYQWGRAQDRDMTSFYSPENLWGDFERFEMDANAAHAEARARIRQARQGDIEREKTERARQELIELEGKAKAFLLDVSKGKSVTQEQEHLLNLALDKTPFMVIRGVQKPCPGYVCFAASPATSELVRGLREVKAHLGMSSDTWLAGKFSEDVLAALSREKELYPLLWELAA